MNFEGKSQYNIVRIDSFEQAQQYGQYTSWCVTHDENMFNSYTNNGIGQFYFCLRHGFETEKAHRKLCRVRDEQKTFGKIHVNTEL